MVFTLSFIHCLKARINPNNERKTKGFKFCKLVRNRTDKNYKDIYQTNNSFWNDEKTRPFGIKANYSFN